MTGKSIVGAYRRRWIGGVGAFLLVAISMTLWACESTEVEERPGPVAASGDVQEFTLVGYMDGYVGVGGEIEGQQNPDLIVRAGDEVRITFINGENMPHDIAFKDHDVASDMLLRPDEETTIEFIAQSDDTYYCTVPGHEQAGMVGKLAVTPSGDQGDGAEPRAQLEVVR